MLRNCILLFSAICMPSAAQAADPPADSSQNTYSVILENLKSGEKSKITVSGPAESDQTQTKDLAERLARDAFNGDAKNQPIIKESGKSPYSLKSDYLQGNDGTSMPKYLLPKDYVYVLPGYSNGSLGSRANMPGNAPDPLYSLVAENAKLKEVIRLQEDQIKLLQDELSSLQGK